MLIVVSLGMVDVPLGFRCNSSRHRAMRAVLSSLSASAVGASSRYRLACVLLLFFPAARRHCANPTPLHASIALATKSHAHCSTPLMRTTCSWLWISFMCSCFVVRRLSSRMIEVGDTKPKHNEPSVAYDTTFLAHNTVTDSSDGAGYLSGAPNTRVLSILASISAFPDACPPLEVASRQRRFAPEINWRCGTAVEVITPPHQAMSRARLSCSAVGTARKFGRGARGPNHCG